MKPACRLAASALLVASALLASACGEDDAPVGPPATVGTLPTITLTADTPTVGNGLVATHVVAGDAEGLAEVRLYAGDRWVARSTTAPYELTWSASDLAEGLYELRALAIDSDGNQASAESVFAVDHSGPELEATLSPTAAALAFDIRWTLRDANAPRWMHLRIDAGQGVVETWRCTAATGSIGVRGCRSATVTLQGEDEVGNLGAPRSLLVESLDLDQCGGIELSSFPADGDCERE